MGAVPWAAYDPVFWVHHANIDRIWAGWNRSGGKNPSDSKFLSESWVFADKAGKAVTTKVSQVLDTTTCPYPTYIYSEYPQRPKASLQFTTTQKKFQLQAQSLWPPHRPPQRMPSVWVQGDDGGPGDPLAQYQHQPPRNRRPAPLPCN